MSKSKKIILSVVASVIVVAVIVCAIILTLPKNQNTAKTVMQVNVNPSCQFVLDGNNNVMYVNCLNSDAEVCVNDEEFVGLSAQDAAKKLVELATKSGYLQVSQQGDVYLKSGDSANGVKIIFYTNEGEQINNLKQSVINKVNEYFDENGIIYGAVCKVNESFKDALKMIDTNITRLYNMTEEEILEQIVSTSKNIQGIAVSVRNETLDKYAQICNQFNVTNLENMLDNISAQLSQAQSELLEYEMQLLNNPLMNSVIEMQKQTIKELESQVKLAKENLQQVLQQVQQQFDSAVETYQQQSAEIFYEAKQQFKQDCIAFKTSLENHKQYFEEHKTEVMQKINEFRQNLPEYFY